VNSRSGKRRVGVPARREVPSRSVRPEILHALVRPLAVLAVVVFAAAILANSMTKEVGRDEQMYCTAGVLLGRGLMIYRDFSYPSQLPYHPLLLATLYRGLDTMHYLLVGRLVSAVSGILTMILILLIYRAVFGTHRLAGVLFGLAAVALVVFNPFVDYAAGYAWNHDVVILCVVLALGLLLTTDFQKPSRYWRIAIIGALLTLATCMRVTTALVELAFLGAILWMAGGSLRNRSLTALPFSVAALAVLLWPAWVIAQAPQAFWLNLVRIPALYGRWLHEIGMTFGKVPLTVSALLTPGYLILLVVAGVLLWAGLRYRRHLDTQERRKAAFAALLPLVFLVIAYIPPTMWHQYLAVPVPFIAIAFVYPLLALRRFAEQAGGQGRYRVVCYAVGIGSGLSIIAYPAVLERAVFSLVPERWVPVEVHRLSRTMMEPVQEIGLVLTLGPLYPLEGGGEIYPELSAGAIVYRIADRLSPGERQITRTVGPETLEELVRDRPPAAVIVGVEPPRFDFLEKPLQALVPPDWHREMHADTLQVYWRP
jgi:hypothetical protein